MRGVLLRGLLGSSLVVASGFLASRMPRGTWVSRLPVVGPVGPVPRHLHLGLLVAFAGLLLLTSAWWGLRPHLGVPLLGLRRTRLAAAGWAAPLLLAPPVFSSDGWSYVATGDLVARGLSPYVWTPAVLPPTLRSGVAPIWWHTPSPYGPVPLAWGGLAARLTEDPWLLLLAHRVLALAGLALLAWGVPRLARRVGHDPTVASWLVVPSPFVLAHGVGGLHNDLPMAAVMVAALVVSRREHWLLGAVLAGTAAAVKLPGGLAAVGVVLLSLGPATTRLRRLGRTASVGLVSTATLLAWGVVTGLGAGWVGALAVPDGEKTPLALTSDLGRLLRGALLAGGAAGHHLVRVLHPEALVKDVGVVALVVLLLWVLLVRRRGTDAAAVSGTALVLLGAVVLSPAVHYWYALWCLPVLACLPLRTPGRWALVAWVAALGLVAPAQPALHLGWLWRPAAWATVLVPVLAALVAVRAGRVGRASGARTLDRR